MSEPRLLLGRLYGARSGAAAVEFAILAIPVVVLLLGLVETGRAIHARTNMALAADAALRAASLDPALDVAQLQLTAQDAFNGGPSGALSLTRTAEGTGLDIIELQYPLTLLIPGLTERGLTLTVTRRVP